MARRPDLGYFADGKNLLDPAIYAQATAPFGQATNLPVAAYRSLEFALLEDEAVWTRDWIAIGKSSDIPSSGDILPFTVGNHGIHVQRMADGSLEGRFNNAQHGGCRFVPVQCQGGTKTKCSFTSCGYSRDGDAIRATEGGHGVPAMHQYLGLRPERLLRVSVSELHGMILVNVDGPDKCLPPDAGVNGHIRSALSDKLDLTGKRWMEFDCNWKLLAQVLAATEEGVSATHHNAITTRRTLSSGEVLSALWLFPNVVIVSAGSAACLMVLQQTAIERTLCRVYIHGTSQSVRSDSKSAMLLAEVSAAAERAVSAQKALSQPNHPPADFDPLQRDTVAYWGQAMLVRRLMDLPSADHAAPMFQSTRHYAI
ncbi:hypothetical protein [Mesorhizobium sp. YR577]|uniref:hypothetical protein n=1 Tax=Mesorhizobium sp. YR577 TaxID=1884373 RepID=UPI0008F3B87A|nr:hypothetical protein [Mesorhizobium sp. YR577]SFU19040.1 hypothetical protein SAMN05518861_12057 [Mesorhizobium sp. YR577]